MTNEQKIREACIKANPSILELKFGCVVLWSYEHQIGGIRSRGGVCRFRRTKRGIVTYAHYYQGYINGKDTSYACVEFERAITVRKIPITELKILGHEIRLSDVLNAVSELSNWELRDDVSEEIKKKYGLTDVDGIGYSVQEVIIALWNLLEDNLSEQAEETKAFITLLLS